MSIKLYVTPTTLFMYLCFCCLWMHFQCARLDFEQLVKRNRRDNDRTKQESLLKVLRLLNSGNFDSREAMQMLGEKRYSGSLGFGTDRGDSGAKQAKLGVGNYLANQHNNPGKRKRRQSIKSLFQ